MAMTMNQLVSGQAAVRPPSPDALAARATPRKSNASAETELARASEPGGKATSTDVAEVEAGGAQVESPELDRAVEEANQLAESSMRATNRSVTFGRHEGSGRITITIHEEVNGKEVERQIPPESLLRLVERLKALGEKDPRATAGSIVETKA